MDVTGQWYYARWLGGGCRLDTGAEWNAEIGGKGIIFSEGKLKIPLQYSIDGWWEGPPDSGLRVCRHKSYLILQRRKDSKGCFKEVRATSSLCRAACLCYMSTIGSIFLKPGKATVPTQSVPSASLAPSAEGTECIPEPQCTPEQLCESCRPEVSSAAELKEEAQPEPNSVQDAHSSPTSREWPEPEAEGLPDQPSLGSRMPSDEFPETTCDEKLAKPPQILTSFHGVTSLGHGLGTTANVITLGEPARSPRPPLREVIETLGTALETDYPVVDGAADASDINPDSIEDQDVPAHGGLEDSELSAMLDLSPTLLKERMVANVEEHEAPTSIAIPHGNHEVPTSIAISHVGLEDSELSATLDLSPTSPEERVVASELLATSDSSPASPEERVVADVEDLSTTMYGLFTVPEHAELPDVPCPAEPSRSNSCLLHGGSVFPDGSSNTWLREENDIPQEVSILQREPAMFSNGRQMEMGIFMNADERPPGDEEDPEEDEEEEDPRLRPNPLMRSNKVSGSLSRSC